MRKNAFDDGLRPELLEHSSYDGIFEIPKLNPPAKIVEPTDLVPFSRRNRAKGRMVHFYEHDVLYQNFTNHPERFVSELSRHPGIIGPDNSVFADAPLCAQIANIFISRRNASFLQHQGIYVIPNVRWGDERTFCVGDLPEAIAFSGIPHHSIVSVGTYGCCKAVDEKRLMHLGLQEMLKTLRPSVVIVYGPTPSDVFCELPLGAKFLRFDNWEKERHLHPQAHPLSNDYISGMALKRFPIGVQDFSVVRKDRHRVPVQKHTEYHFNGHNSGLQGLGITSDEPR